LDKSQEQILQLRIEAKKLNKNFMNGANELSKEEFAKEYPDWVDEYENVQVGPYEPEPSASCTVSSSPGPTWAFSY
jgi:hypothetical protein